MTKRYLSTEKITPFHIKPCYVYVKVFPPKKIFWTLFYSNTGHHCAW